MDSSIVAGILHNVAADFKNTDSINWVALAYTLANLGTVVVFARVSDIVGRRNAFMAAKVMFSLFSLACGFSQNLPQLVAFRALQGIGGAGKSSIPGNYDCIAELYRPLLTSNNYVAGNCSRWYISLCCCFVGSHSHRRGRQRSYTWWCPRPVCYLAMGFLDQVSGCPRYYLRCY